MQFFSHYAKTLRTLKRTLQTKCEGKATSRPLKKTYRQHNTLNIYSNGNKNNKQQACDDMG